MLAKRVIACLDVRNGRVVKGRQFIRLKDQGNPARRAVRYEQQGADEIVLLDVTATRQGRLAFGKTVRQVASVLQIPLTVGGGIRSVADAEVLFSGGADKVSVNSAAVQNPELITELADRFGSQSTVVAIDARKNEKSWNVWTRSGTHNTGLDAVAWAQQAQRLGAGEILLTSMDQDGTREGFDVELLSDVKKNVHVPVVASGGAGRLEDFKHALNAADAVLAAGLFHSDALTIGDIKQYLKKNGVTIRP